MTTKETKSINILYHANLFTSTGYAPFLYLNITQDLSTGRRYVELTDLYCLIYGAHDAAHDGYVNKVELTVTTFSWYRSVLVKDGLINPDKDVAYCKDDKGAQHIYIRIATVWRIILDLASLTQKKELLTYLLNCEEDAYSNEDYGGEDDFYDDEDDDPYEDYVHGHEDEDDDKDEADEDTRLTLLEDRVEHLDAQLDDMDELLNDLKEQVDSFSDRLDQTHSVAVCHNDAIDERFTAIKARLDYLEAHIDNLLDDVGTLADTITRMEDMPRPIY
jgi:hypothetical protein|nr:MAG TPA: outer capsid protein sigma-1 attachment protein [Caudoviricetes sp.]